MSSDNKTFICSIRYMEPVEGTSYITAKSEEDAKEKAQKMFSWRNQFEVIAIEESPDSQMVLDMQAEAQEQMDMLDKMGFEFPSNPKKEDIN